MTTAALVPRISVRDEKDVRVLIAALSLYAVHTHTTELATTAEELCEELASGPTGERPRSAAASLPIATHIPERA